MKRSFQILIVEPINCKWNDWNVGECSKSCAGGTRTNTRTLRWEAQDGGTCEGNSTVNEPCNTQECPSKLLILSSI